MYDLIASQPLRNLRSALAFTLAAVGLAAAPPDASAQGFGSGSVVRRIENANDSLEITTNTSRILTLDKKIPKVQVNNPELLAVTPLSATEIQISAKKAGVTQVNLWDDDGEIHTVDVFIYGDVRELEHALKTQFPNSSVRVYRYSQSLVLTGFIDRPDYVDPIRQLAEDYAPKVINNIAVGGVQQVLLKVKIYEVSRTKLRQLGVDFGTIGDRGYLGTSVSGLLNNVGTSGNPAGLVQQVSPAKVITDSAGQTVEFMVTNGSDALVGFLNAMQERSVAKILAEPNIVAVSGRPSTFRSGGEIPIPIPQGLGTTAIEYKPYGTQVEFLPIVLGNGKIRLEVRPSVSDLDPANAITISSFSVPAIKDRMADTAVEMYAGQTFAIAGLIQQRTATKNAGVPFLSDIPIIGLPFRNMTDDSEEVELLILVTPELVDAMEPHEVPPCGPGMASVPPKDCDLYIDGKVEVRNLCGPCADGSCGCCPRCNSGGFPGPPNQLVNGYGAGAGYGGAPTLAPTPAYPGEMLPNPRPAGAPAMEGETVYPEGAQGATSPSNGGPTLGGPTFGKADKPSGDAQHYRAMAQQPMVRQAARAYQPAPTPAGGSGLIGPVGYDED